MCVVNGRFNPDKDNFTSICTKGSAVVDYFLTNHRNVQNIENFEVITISDVVDLLGVHGMAAVPAKISDHSMLVIDIFTRDADVLRSVTEDSGDRRPSERLTDVRFEGDMPSPPPRFRINEIPSDFLSSDESRQQLLNIISDIEEARITQQEINKIYNDIVEVYIAEMKGHFGRPLNYPCSRKKIRFTRKEWWDEELTSLFREMQHAEHPYIKSKRNRGHYKFFFNIYKRKQAVFDKVLKRKKIYFQRMQCLRLEEVNSTDSNAFWDYIRRLFNRITTMNPDKLPKIVYDWDRSLGLESWGSEIRHISASLSIDIDSNDGDIFSLTDANNIFLNQNRATWQSEAYRKPKLRTFVQIHDFDSNQLLVKSGLTRYHRSLLSQLKFGILPLKIETDRYQGIPPDRQICKLCDLNTPEDEAHFLFSCPTLTPVRDSAYVYFENSILNLNSENPNEILAQMCGGQNGEICWMSI